MALIGKKAKADSADAANGAAPDAAPAGKKKKVREPKAAPKPKGLKNGTAVGLNIGNAYIKAVEITAKNGEFAITGMGAVQTPPECYANGNVLSVSALAGAIKTLWKQAGFKSRSAVFSVSGTGSLVVRVIEVPKMSDGELADNMRVDADRYIPFPPSEVIMDFKALRDLPSDPDAPNMEVLLAAAQREIIDLHVRVVQKSGLNPAAIDVEPIAAARAIGLSTRGMSPFVDYDDVSALLNVGATGTEISVLRGDLVVFTRTVPIGGNNLSLAVADGLGLPLHDAERYKIERGDALPPAGYDPNASNAFDFDEFGGATADDLSFGAFDTGSQTATATAATATATDTTAVSGDPFDLDFFSQGPQAGDPETQEPGAGHAQKEGEEPTQPASFSFSFDNLNDDMSDLPSVAAPEPTPAPEPDAAPPAHTDFSFGFPDAMPESASSALNMPDEYLPEPEPFAPPVVAESVAAEAAPTPSIAPQMPVAAEPPASPQAAPAMPMASAFDFSDFDLPAAGAATSPVGTGAVTATPVPSTPPPTSGTLSDAASTPSPGAAGFGFTDEPAAGLVAETLPSGATAPPVAEAAAPAMNLGKEPDAAPSAFDVTAFDATAFDTSTPEATAPALDLNKIEDSPLVASDIAPPGDVLTAAATASAPDLDLDSIFNPPAHTSETLEDTNAGARSAADDAFDIGGLDFGAGAGAAATGLGSGIDLGDAGQAGLEDFGVGLGTTHMSDADAIVLYQAMHPVLEELASEVRRSLEFHLGRYPDTNFSRLQLIGGGARLKNLDAYLTQMIGVPTAVAQPSATVSLQAPKLSPEYVAANGPMCTVALGLALRDFIE